MVDREKNNAVKYHRRLDRTPEKQFEKLPESEKKLISAMRSALENCKNTVNSMKEELEEKEKAVETERIYRKAAEEKLKSYLVDPYPSPDVNLELRNRLPHAKKTDPLVEREHFSTEESGVDENELEVTQTSRNNLDIMGTKKKNKKTRRYLNFQSTHRQHISKRNYDQHHTDGDEEDSSESEVLPHERVVTNTRGKKSHHNPWSSPQLNSLLHSSYPMNRHKMYPGAYFTQYPPPRLVPSSLTPWSSLSSLNMFGPSKTPGNVQDSPKHSRNPLPHSQSFPNLLNPGDVTNQMNPGVRTSTADDAGEQVQCTTAPRLHFSPEVDVNAEISRKPVDTSQTTADGAREVKNQGVGFISSHDAIPVTAIPSQEHFQSTSSMSSHYGLPHSFAWPDYPPFCMPVNGLPAPTPGASKLAAEVAAQQMAFLHEEIGRLKEINKQVMEKLATRTQELEALKLKVLAKSSVDSTADVATIKKMTDFMLEMKTAQEKQLKVMETRIRQADEDRDEALMELENSIKTKTHQRAKIPLDENSSWIETEDSDEEIEVEMDACAAQAITKQKQEFVASDTLGIDLRGIAMLKEMERRHERESEIFREELQVVMKQRDHALDQLQLERQKQYFHEIHMPTQREQILMAKITSLQGELDTAYDMICQLQEELTDIKLLNSLHKALFSNDALNDLATVNRGDSKLIASKFTDTHNLDNLKPNVKEDNQLLEQLRQANQEKATLQKRCQKLEADWRQEVSEKSMLQRLNGVLQKKLVASENENDLTQED